MREEIKEATSLDVKAMIFIKEKPSRQANAMVSLPIDLLDDICNLLFDIIMQTNHMNELKLNKNQCRKIGDIIEKLGEFKRKRSK